MKTATYTYIDYQNLEELIEEHLGVEISGPKNNWRQGFNIQSDLECSNDSFHIFDGVGDKFTDWLSEGEPDWMKTPYYIAKLQEMGVIPKEYPVLLEVSW